jgi:hypothetical protein
MEREVQGYPSVQKPLCGNRESGCVEGRKALDQARSLMIMHTEDAYVKLFAGADTADKAWRKLHENFKKTSNARVVQLRKKLTNLTLIPRKSIAEYVGEFRKMDLETAGQTVSELELAVHALNGLPKEYATLVEYRELSETELTLDMIQPKLMQREQKLKSLGVEVESPKEEEEESFRKAFVAKRERYGATVTKGLSERGNTGGVKGEASDMRTCHACGEKGHVRAHCRKRSAECYNCGERGHISSVCRKPRGDVRSGGEDRKEFAGVAFTAWPKEARAPTGVWLVDSESTQHITAVKSQFCKLREACTSTEDRGAWGRSRGSCGDWEGRLGV